MMVVGIMIACYSIKIALLGVLNLLGQLSETRTRTRTFARTCNQCQQKQQHTHTHSHTQHTIHAAESKEMYIYISIYYINGDYSCQDIKTCRIKTHINVSYKI